MSVDITVAVCTYNRSSVLPRALDSLLMQTLSVDHFEILVVDNGSSDDTAEVVSVYRSRVRRLRYVRESRPGIAHARNRAIEEAQGTLLAFLDDDAWAEQEWLVQLCEPSNPDSRDRRGDPACTVGPVLLEWEGVRPAWFPEHSETLLCRYDMGPAPRLLGSADYLLTTNVLFHRPTLQALGGFRPYLGRRRGRPLGGEDNDIFRRLINSGQHVYYQPTAKVHHGVPSGRQTRRYFLHRLFWDGASQPLLDRSTAEEHDQIFCPWRGAYIDVRQLVRQVADMIVQLFLLRRNAAWELLLKVVHRAGRLRMHVALALRIE
jgi:glycosyltransferase involved in cell wall biosynthesis